MNLIRTQSILVLILCATYGNAQVAMKEYKFKEVGWTVQLPETYPVLSTEQENAAVARGQKAFEDTYDTTFDFSATRTLISAKNGVMNYFGATVTPFDPATDGSWEEANEMVKQVMTETMSAQIPGAAIDTASSTVIIDKILFYKFYVSVKFSETLVLHSFLYTRLHRGYDFGISIVYTDEENGKLLKEVVESSKFDK